MGDRSGDGFIHETAQLQAKHKELRYVIDHMLKDLIEGNK